MLTFNYVCLPSGLRPVIISKVDYENKSLIEVENLLCWSWEEEDDDDVRFSLVFVRRARKKFAPTMDRSIGLDCTRFREFNIVDLCRVCDYVSFSSLHLLRTWNCCRQPIRQRNIVGFIICGFDRSDIFSVVLSIRWNLIFFRSLILNPSNRIESWQC